MNIEEIKKKLKKKQDYIVVKSFETAEDLVRCKSKDLAGKYIIVAPEGLELVGNKSLLKVVLPFLRETNQWWTNHSRALLHHTSDKFLDFLEELVKGKGK